MAMGNTERAWTQFYDMHYQKRECQAGIAAMSAWRAGMLSRADATAVLSDRPSHADHASGSSQAVRAPTSAAASNRTDIVIVLD